MCCRIKSELLSSAYSLVRLRRCLAISLMYTQNKRDPQTDPCGTTAKIDFKPAKQDFRPTF